MEGALMQDTMKFVAQSREQTPPKNEPTNEQNQEESGQIEIEMVNPRIR